MDIDMENAKAGATILLGLPGLTDKQSIELLLQTIEWLNYLPIKYIQIGYLVQKKKTVQEYIYSNLRSDEELANIGVVKNERTGLMDIIVLFDTIMKIFEIDSDIYKKIIFSPQNFLDNGALYRNSDKYGLITELEEYILKNIINITSLGTKNINSYKEIYESLKGTLEYKESMERLEKQHGLVEMKETIRIVGRKLTNKLFDESLQLVLLDELEEELKFMNDI